MHENGRTATRENGLSDRYKKRVSPGVIRYWALRGKIPGSPQSDQLANAQARTPDPHTD
jgi:hypothetical protein